MTHLHDVNNFNSGDIHGYTHVYNNKYTNKMTGLPAIDARQDKVVELEWAG